MASSDSNKYSNLPLVPESVLRRRHDLDDLVRKRKALQEIEKSQPSKKRVLGSHFYVKKPESFIARSKSRHNSMIRYNRVKSKGMQKRASNRPVYDTKTITPDIDNDEEEATIVTKFQKNSVGAKVVFVIRIRDHQGTPKTIRNSLSKLGLRSVHAGVFVRYTEAKRALLHKVEPWVIYGRPSAQVIADLIERRGYARLSNDGKKERVPLSDNTIIELNLGAKYNIICKEDLVHVLDSVDDDAYVTEFDAVTKFLFPFQLIDNKTHFERQTLKLKDGKDYGDRGDEINEYIQQVL